MKVAMAKPNQNSIHNNKPGIRKHSCEGGTSQPTAKTKHYKISNAELQAIAKNHEVNDNNNNIFNGKNISDNSKITSFYTLKSLPPYQSPLLYFGTEQINGKAAKVIGEQQVSHVPESQMVKTFFTNNVALNQCDNCKPQNIVDSNSELVGGDKITARVSAVMKEPKLNSKYDDAWYLQHNPQHWNNLRTMGQLKDLTKIEDDPIMKLNPTLYKVVQEAKADLSNFRDPFQKIMEQQHTWIDAKQKNSYIKDIVYHTDIDHPMSLHNQSAGLSNSLKVEFPKSNLSGTQLRLGGFYDKDPYVLQNKFKPHNNDHLQPVDHRIYDNAQKFNYSNTNQLYKPNEKLLREIAENQLSREHQRNLRLEQEARARLVEQRVEEISPSGMKRPINQVQQDEHRGSDTSGKKTQYLESTGKRDVLNPFNEDTYGPDSIPRNMFSIKMANGPSNQELDGGDSCRKDLPDRNQQYKPEIVGSNVHVYPNNTVSLGGDAPNYFQVEARQTNPHTGTFHQTNPIESQQSILQDSLQQTESPQRQSIEYQQNNQRQPTPKENFYRNQDSKKKINQSTDEDPPSTLKRRTTDKRRNQQYYEDQGEDGEEYGDEEYQGETDNRRIGKSAYGEDYDEEQEDEGEDRNWNQDQESEDTNSLAYQSQVNKGLEDRLEQIKQNIKNQKEQNEQMRKNLPKNSTKDQLSYYSKQQQSIEQLEDVLKRQREKLDDLQASQASRLKTSSQVGLGLYGGERSKEILEFELSKASPYDRGGSQKYSQGHGTTSKSKTNGVNTINNGSSKRPGDKAPGSSSNLERAYEELEREIMEIKKKLQQSVNEGKATESRKKDKLIMSASSKRQQLQFGSRGLSNKTRYQGTSGKSRGRSGVEDDPDYSLSASELNSNANSLLKSATRGAGGILTNTYEFR